MGPTPGCTTADCGEDTATTPTDPSPTLMPPTLTPMSTPTTAFPTLTMARGLLMLSPPLMPSPPLMLRPIPGWLMAMAITLTAMVMLDTEDTMATPMLTTARGLLMLSPPLMPSLLLMLRPIPGWLMAMAITPIATAMPDTEDTTATLMPTMARGLLMLSPPLMPSPLPMLRPIPGWLMAMAITPIATAMPDTEDTTATLMPTMARGLLMLSPPLMLTLRPTPG